MGFSSLCIIIIRSGTGVRYQTKIGEIGQIENQYHLVIIDKIVFVPSFFQPRSIFGFQVANNLFIVVAARDQYRDSLYTV